MIEVDFKTYYAAEFEVLKDKSQNKTARMKYADATSQCRCPSMPRGR
jgi:hypothetical protein